MKKYNFPILQHEDVVKFIKTNELNVDDVMPFLAEIKMYVSNPEKFQLIWDGMVLLEKVESKINSGLYYLEEDFFKEEIAIQDLHIKTNPIKRDFFSKYDSNIGYYLVGDNGIGKTFLACAFSNLHYEKTKEKTLFVFWPDFIEKTKRFGDNNIHYINKVKYAKRLIIDDLGQESITSWSRDDILNSIIAFRLEKKLHTTITSNYYQRELTSIYTLREIEAKKAKGIVNKIKALSSEYSLAGEDLRNEK
ncbi:MAG: ATP-binding protein [Spiroplasma sp.]|nr:ATP-binding protein [Mycoplasmatales bacterium]